MDRPSRYILTSDGTPVPCESLIAWALWIENSDEERQVARDELPGGSEVNTVFLALDYNWGDGPPVLFETMVFGGPHDRLVKRYTTRAEALAGHARIVAELRGIAASMAN
jgi:hypothetical protein